MECGGGVGARGCEVQLKSCYLDVCFGMNEHALQMAKKNHFGVVPGAGR